MATQRDAATARSPLFTVLPPEVRDAILTAAFGGSTLHIQRCYLATPQAKAQGQGSRPGWARGNARQWLGGLFATSKSKAKREEVPPAGHGRRWYACVCDRDHRDIEPVNSPAADNCLFGIERSQWDGTDALDVPAELAIGAIGWLLTCRQAYNEGVKVLYASNTFHIRSGNLRAFGGFIPQVPEAGLSYITSMELVMDPRFAASPKTDDSVSQADILEDTLSLIVSLMPRLRHLYLGFCPFTCLLKDCQSRYKLTYECSKYQIGLAETTVRALHQAGRSCGLELGLPWTLFERYTDEFKEQYSRLKMADPHRKPGDKTDYHKFSRLRLFFHVQDQRLDPDSEDGKITVTDVGYWISMSSFDFDHVQRCFGTTSVA